MRGANNRVMMRVALYRNVLASSLIEAILIFDSNIVDTFSFVSGH